MKGELKTKMYCVSTMCQVFLCRKDASSWRAGYLAYLLCSPRASYMVALKKNQVTEKMKKR